MTVAVEGLRLANARFYTALGQGDLAAMSAVWLHSDEVICVHPGWPAITGWAAIRQSWETIFEHQGVLRVWPTGIRVKVDGRLGLVVCFENIDAAATAGGGIVQARARNRFLLVRGRWRMLEHRAQPISAFRRDASGLPFSEN